MSLLYVMVLMSLGSLIGGLLSGPIIGLVGSLVAGALAKPIADLIQMILNAEDKLPGPIKTIVVGVTGVLLGALGSIIPGIPSTLGGFDSTTIMALVSGGIGLLAHHQAATAAATTTAVRVAISQSPAPATLRTVPPPDAGSSALLGKR